MGDLVTRCCRSDLIAEPSDTKSSVDTRWLDADGRGSGPVCRSRLIERVRHVQARRAIALAHREIWVANRSRWCSKSPG